MEFPAKSPVVCTGFDQSSTPCQLQLVDPDEAIPLGFQNTLVQKVDPSAPCSEPISLTEACIYCKVAEALAGLPQS